MTDQRFEQRGGASVRFHSGTLRWGRGAMDSDEMAIEEKKLRLQKWQGWVQALAPLAAVGVLAVTFFGTVNASLLNAETARRDSELQGTQVVAETGERLCVPQLGGQDPL